MSETAPLPFWLVNVPREQWPAECPGFLGHLSEKDQFIIGTPDTEYKRLGWPKVREIVGIRPVTQATCMLLLSNAIVRERRCWQVPSRSL
jgi:hypothetical protein